MKVLLLDIETSPNLGYFWSIWEQNIPLSNVRATSDVLCWAAKWLGEEEVMFDSVYDSSKKQMLKRMHRLLDETNVVVHYNGKRFDIPTLNREFLLAQMPPPAPYKQVDLFHVVKDKFRFLSNKLNFVSQQLGIGEKEKHRGIQLWVDCLAKKEDAWEEMERYNKQDVLLLEKAYIRILPWITNHPNRSKYDEEAVCPNCGSDHKHKRGQEPRRGKMVQRFQCVPCGGTWFVQLTNGKTVHANG